MAAASGFCEDACSERLIRIFMCRRAGERAERESIRPSFCVWEWAAFILLEDDLQGSDDGARNVGLTRRKRSKPRPACTGRVGRRVVVVCTRPSPRGVVSRVPSFHAELYKHPFTLERKLFVERRIPYYRLGTPDKSDGIRCRLRLPCTPIFPAALVVVEPVRAGLATHGRITYAARRAPVEIRRRKRQWATGSPYYRVVHQPAIGQSIQHSVPIDVRKRIDHICIQIVSSIGAVESLPQMGVLVVSAVEIAGRGHPV